MSRQLLTVFAIAMFFATATYTTNGCAIGDDRQHEASPRQPPPPSAAISGRVTNSGTDAAIDGVELVVRPAGWPESFWKSAVTDVNGNYAIDAISPGGAMIEINATGYQAFSQWIVITTGANRIDVKLIPDR